MQLSLRDSIGLGAPSCRSLKVCRTVDSPRNPRWHERDEDTAVPVCGACTLLGAFGSRGGGDGLLHGAPGASREAVTLSPPGE